VPRLLASLEESPASPDLARAREADDQAALREVFEDAEVRTLAGRPDRVRLLWEVCQIPDFRKVAGTDHAQLIGRIYRFLLGPRRGIPSDWIAGQVKRIDRTDGDIDTLAKRLSFIRTWTYVANRSDWVENAAEWQETTRAVEDRLSDALHARLTQRFVDRRTSVLMRRLKQKERLVAEVNDKGEVTVEGEFLGRIDGFRFTLDPDATPDEVKTLRSASTGALQAELARRADRLYLAPDTAIEMTEQGGLVWDEAAIGRLVKGDDPLGPRVQAFVDDTAEPAVVEKIERRLAHWIDRRIKALFEPMLKMRDDEGVTGLARGVAFQLVEAMGVIPRRQIADDVKALGQEERAQLRRHGVRFGQHTIFMPLLLKPAPTRLRLLLWSLFEDHEEVPSPPPAGQVTLPRIEGMPKGYWDKAGYRLCGSRAVRIDMLERLADMIRPMDAKEGFEATADMLSITGCTLDQFAEIMQGLGFHAEKGERAKPPRPAKDAKGAPAPDGADAPAEAEAGAAVPSSDGSAGEAGPGAGAGAPPETSETADAARAPAADPADAASAEPAPAQPAPAGADPDTGAEAADAAAELETYYVFTLRPRRPAGQRRRRQPDQQGASGEARPPRRERGQGDAARDGEAPSGDGDAGGRGKGKGKGPKGKGPRRGDGPQPDVQRQQGRPKGKPREEKPVDPDSPFAVLQQLKNR
jgi:ATP-dependent RNA helicase SUPV3L1/SUV3